MLNMRGTRSTWNISNSEENFIPTSVNVDVPLNAFQYILKVDYAQNIGCTKLVVTTDKSPKNRIGVKLTTPPITF